jgi:anti-sigma factor RsiW
MKPDFPIQAATRDDVHRECWDLLPWLVTGRLSQSDRARVELHLKECASCRDELAAQRRLHELVASADERVIYSPASSFEKLWSRVEELEREVPGAQAPSPVQYAPRISPLARWLAAAVIVQAVALAWLTIAIATRGSPEEWPFRTVTSSVPSTAVPHFRIVFAADVSPLERERTLANHGLLIADASASSEVLIAAPAGRETVHVPDEILARLRADRQVRFAELVTGVPDR